VLEAATGVSVGLKLTGSLRSRVFDGGGKGVFDEWVGRHLHRNEFTLRCLCGLRANLSSSGTVALICNVRHRGLYTFSGSVFGAHAIELVALTNGGLDYEVTRDALGLCD